MPARMEFQLNLPKSLADPVRRDPDAPLRLLIMADFSGRGQREAPNVMADLASRPLLTVDVDNLNAVMARLAPKLRLPLGTETGGAALTISFARLDDFHPAEHPLHGVGRIERNLFFLFPATFHDAQRVLQQDFGEGLAGFRAPNRHVWIGEMDQRKRPDVIGVCVSEQNGVRRAKLLQTSEVGKLASLAGRHTNPSIDEDFLARDLQHQTRSPDFVCASKKV